MVRETIRKSCRRPVAECLRETLARRRPRSRRRARAIPATLAGLAWLAGGLALTPPAALAADGAGTTPAAGAAAPASAAEAAPAPPADAADPVVAEVLRMLRGGVASPVVALWLDKSGKRPAAVGSGDLVALHEAGASDELLKRLIQLAGGATTGPSAAVPAGVSATAGAQPAATARPAPSVAASAPSSAASAPGATPAPAAPAPAVPSVSIASAPSPPAPAASSTAAAAPAAASMVKTRFAVTYRPISVDDESQVSEPWWLVLYVDGRFVASVKPGPALLPLPPRTFDHELAPGRHLLRVAQERHLTRGAGRGYTSRSRVDPSEISFELGPAGEAQIAVRFGEKSFRHPGPIAVSVEQADRQVARLEPSAPDAESWPAVCEDIPAAVPAGSKLPSAARQDLAKCVHWAALWPGIAAVPSRDEVRAEVGRLAAADRRTP
jgi:hypothetical protein